MEYCNILPKCTKLISILWVLLFTCNTVYAEGYGIPSIDPVIVGQTGINDRITITGTNFGPDPTVSSSYITITGFKVPESNIISWTDSAITLTIPSGAASGKIRVHTKEVSNPVELKIDYASDIDSNLKATDSKKFGIKDMGGIGGSTRIEGEPGWAYVASNPAIITYDLSTSPPTIASIMYMPAKIANMTLYKKYLYIVGSFGLRIYNTSDLKAGFIGTEPEPAAAYTDGLALFDVDAQAYSGIPINGTIVAAIQPMTTFELYLFSWDGETKTLDLLLTHYNSDYNFPSPLGYFYLHIKSIRTCELDPIHPKAYVSTYTQTWTLQPRQYISEYDITNASTGHITELKHTPYQPDGATQSTKTIGDMEAYQDQLWIAEYGLVSLTTPTFTTYTTQPGVSNFLSLHGHIKACTVDPVGGPDAYGYSHPACTTNFNCQWRNPMGHSCNPLQQCQCIEGVCQDCIVINAHGSIDIIEELGLVVGTTGEGGDASYKHNIFLMNAANASGTHKALATSESIDWSYDIAGIPGKLLVADEWVQAITLDFTSPPNPYSITHHQEPGWKEPSRMFSSGIPWWFYTTEKWRNRFYGGDGFFSMDKNNMSDFNLWYQYSKTQKQPWWISSYAHRDDNIVFGKGSKESYFNFWDGGYLFVMYENPDHTIQLLADPEDQFYPGEDDPVKVETGFPVIGNALWWEDNVVITSLANYGVAAFYVNPDNFGAECSSDDQCKSTDQGSCISGQCRWATITEKERIAGDRISPATNNAAVELYQDIIKIDSDTFGVAKSWRWRGEVTIPENWGGIKFYDVSYTENKPPTPDNPTSDITFSTSAPTTVNCLLGLAIVSIDTKIIGSDHWIVVVYQTPDTAFTVGGGPVDYVAVFKYNEIPALNNYCLDPSHPDYSKWRCNNQLDALTISNKNYTPALPSSLASPKDAIIFGEESIAVSVSKGSGPFQIPCGIFIFNLPDGTLTYDKRMPLSQKYYYPAFSAPVITTEPTNMEDYADLNAPMLSTGTALMEDDGDLIAFTSGGVWYRLGKVNKEK